MKRKIDTFLLQWKESKVRQPLLVRGARQVGKTYSVVQFGKTFFNNCVVVNFEECPEFRQCFVKFDPKFIMERISIMVNEDIIPGKTLLFLDEIQDCPEAITSLRYFYEKKPELHIICAGSLIEFALKSENFRMPVGRIQSIYMHPLSFSEFLDAMNHSKLNDYLNKINLSDTIDTAIMNKLEENLRLYLVLGGMPKIVDAYCREISMKEIMFLQTGLIKTYEDDFAKYAEKAKHKYLREVYLSVPPRVGKKYKYSAVNPDIQTKFLKDAFHLLCDTLSITKISHTSGTGVPFDSESDEKKFKALFLDIGLMQRMLGLDHSIIFKKELLQINNGSVAEQYVGQELLTLLDWHERNKLFYWSRESKSSNAEIDYLTSIRNIPVPVEVKAGKTGTLRSLKLFLKEHPKSKIGVRFSMHDFSFYENILSLPLYMVNQLERLAEPFL